MDKVTEIMHVLELLELGGYIEIRKEIPETELIAVYHISLEETVKDILKLLK
jgi:hypothetical protein